MKRLIITIVIVVGGVFALNSILGNPLGNLLGDEIGADFRIIEVSCEIVSVPFYDYGVYQDEWILHFTLDNNGTTNAINVEMKFDYSSRGDLFHPRIGEDEGVRYTFQDVPQPNSTEFQVHVSWMFVNKNGKMIEREREIQFGPVKFETESEIVSEIPVEYTASIESWNRTLSMSNHQSGQSIIEVSEGGFLIVGGTEIRTESGEGKHWDVFLVRTDMTGNILWEHNYGGPDYDSGFSVIEVSEGGYLVAGSTRSYGSGSSDIYLVRTDLIGNRLWARNYGGLSTDYGQSVIEVSEGGYIIAGYSWSEATLDDLCLLRIDCEGNLLWIKTYGGPKRELALGDRVVFEVSTGGFIFVGSSESHLGDDRDVFLAKTDENGNLLWNKTYGGSKHDSGSSVIEVRNGGYLFAGTTSSYGEGRNDLYLVKTDANGNLQWNMTYGGSLSDEGRSLVEVSGGGFLITGETDSFGGPKSAYLVRTDDVGKLLWEKTFGLGTTFGRSVIEISEGGGYLIVGHTGSGSSRREVFLFHFFD